MDILIVNYHEDFWNVITLIIDILPIDNACFKIVQKKIFFSPLLEIKIRKKWYFLLIYVYLFICRTNSLKSRANNMRRINWKYF